MLRAFINCLLVPFPALILVLPLLATILGGVSWLGLLCISLLVVCPYVFVVGFPLYCLIQKRGRIFSFQRASLWGLLLSLPVLWFGRVLVGGPLSGTGFVNTLIILVIALVVGLVFKLLSDENPEFSIPSFVSKQNRKIAVWPVFWVVVVVNILTCNFIMNVRLFEYAVGPYSWNGISMLNGEVSELDGISERYLTFHVAPEYLPKLLGSRFHEVKVTVPGDTYGGVTNMAPFWWVGCEQPSRVYLDDEHQAYLFFVEKKRLACYGRIKTF